MIERLRRNENLELDPYLVNAAFIYEDEKRAALESICRQYLDIGREFGLPLLLSTPTWRASWSASIRLVMPRSMLTATMSGFS